MVFNPLRFYQTPGVQALNNVQMDVAISLIVEHFIGKEDFIAFKYTEDQTIITNGNDVPLATVKQKFFSEEVWAIFGEEMGFSYYTFMLPSEY